MGETTAGRANTAAEDAINIGENGAFRFFELTIKTGQTQNREDKPMIRLARMIKRRDLVLWLFTGVAAATLLGAGATAAIAGQQMRWDMISVNFSTSPPTISAGGTDSAFANDGSSIKLTGSGTFVSLGSSTRFSGVALAGGGTWQTFDPTGAPTGSGTYKVLSGPASFHEAPSPVPPIDDLIGNAADTRSGLMVVEILYDDGSHGVLTVSCHLPGTVPVATPASAFEGITVTKDFVGYWNRFDPVPGVDANRTSFHVLSAP
jgi:hypothetical protein